MSCVPAPTCRSLLQQATALWPNRRRASDGICSSEQHRKQNPNSDHDTGDAVDLTHDPANGCDAHGAVRLMVARRDPRIKYVISNGQIARSYDKPGIPAWTWGPYSGSNPHTRHAHVSIYRAARDNTAPWFTLVSPVVVTQIRSDPRMDQIVYVHVNVGGGNGYTDTPYRPSDGWVPKGAVVHTKHPPKVKAGYWEGITASVSHDENTDQFAVVITDGPETGKIGVWATFGKAA
jgi:hypothetical protein